MENLAWNRNILRDGAVKFLFLIHILLVNQINFQSLAVPKLRRFGLLVLGTFGNSFLRLI
jgi:hypothetical protein